MTDSVCPLCKREAKVNPLQNYDRNRVECETCGRYNITFEVVTPNVGTYAGHELHILSAITRQHSEAGKPLTISTDNVSTLMQSVAIPGNPLEMMDRALLYVSEHQSKADDEYQVFFGKDYPLAFGKDGDEFRYLLDALVDRGLLDRRGPSEGRSNQFYRVSPEGWGKVEQLKKLQIDSNQAFVAMWFSDKLQDAWENGFEPALKATGFDPLRVDLAEHNGKIDDFIVAQIRRSGLMVADFTGHRGGVYFEAGFAMGLGIPVVWTCRDTDICAIHLDTRQYNHIVWTTPQELKEKLQNRIAATIPGRAMTQ